MEKQRRGGRETKGGRNETEMEGKGERGRERWREEEEKSERKRGREEVKVSHILAYNYSHYYITHAGL